MQEHPVLAQVAIAYTPMVNRRREVVATRLTVFPDRPDLVPDPQALLLALQDVWPPAEPAAAPLKLAPRPLDPAAAPGAAAGLARPPVVLNLAGEGLLAAVMGARPSTQFMIEVPAFMAGDAAHAANLQAMFGAGNLLMIKGRPLAALAPEVLAVFSHSIVEVGEERRHGPASAGAAAARQVTTVQAGVRTSADAEAAFERGAVAVLGWPMDDDPPLPTGSSSVPSDVREVMALIEGVDRERPVGELEAVLRRDPTLAFRLLRYINSPAFGLRVEVTSFSHALMMLGYQRLKRWLALLLASSAKGPNATALMFAAVRRGLLLEALSREQGDEELRSEMFICGVFSLLDRLLRQPFAELLPRVPVSDRVARALRGEGGPFAPYIRLAQAIEQESLVDVRECSETLMLSRAAVNRAVLSALRAARQLDG